MSIVRLIMPEELELRREGASLFGRCIAEQWPVSADTATGWVYEEFLYRDTIVVGGFDNGELVATYTGTPLSFLWSELQPEEQHLITKGVCALECSVGCEIPGSLIHVGGMSVRKDHRRQGLAHRLFEVTRQEALRRGYFLAVGQTADGGEGMRSLHRVTSLGFAEFPNAGALPPTYGGLRKVWVWRDLRLATTGMPPP